MKEYIEARKSTWFRGINSVFLLPLDKDEKPKLTSGQISLRDEISEKLQKGIIGVQIRDCLCGLRQFVQIADLDRYDFPLSTVICTNCGLIQSNPYFSSNYLEEFYSGFNDNFYRPSLEVKINEYHEKVASYRYRYEFICGEQSNRARKLGSVSGYLRVLEIGCGAGWNLYPFHTDGHFVVGCDFSEMMVQIGRQNGLHLLDGTIEKVTESQFDVLILSHVLEHLVDPLQQIENFLHKLKRGALVYVEVPNADSFHCAKLEIAHAYLFSPRTLTYFLGKLGLTQIDLLEHEGHFGMLFRWDGKDSRVNSQAESSYDVLLKEWPRMKKILMNYRKRQYARRGLRRFHLLGFILYIKRKIFSKEGLK